MNTICILMRRKGALQITFTFICPPLPTTPERNIRYTLIKLSLHMTNHSHNEASIEVYGHPALCDVLDNVSTALHCIKKFKIMKKKKKKEKSPKNL